MGSQTESETGVSVLVNAIPSLLLEQMLLQAVMARIERDSMPSAMAACLHHMEHPEDDHPGMGYLAEK